MAEPKSKYIEYKGVLLETALFEENANIIFLNSNGDFVLYGNSIILYYRVDVGFSSSPYTGYILSNQNFSYLESLSSENSTEYHSLFIMNSLILSKVESVEASFITIASQLVYVWDLIDSYNSLIYVGLCVGVIIDTNINYSCYFI
jgi:hypothetical protein